MSEVLNHLEGVRMYGVLLVSCPVMLIFFILMMGPNSLPAVATQLISYCSAASAFLVRTVSSANTISLFKTFWTLVLPRVVQG